MCNETGDLGGQGHQERDLVLTVAARLAVLDHEDAEHFADMDDGYAEECLEGLLADAQYLVVALVDRRVLQVDRFGPLRDETHDALAGRQGDPTDHLRVESLVGDIHEATAVTITKVDRTDLRIEDHRHPGHEQIQRSPETGCGTDVLDDLSQRVEHGSPSEASATVNAGANSRSARRYTPRLKAMTCPTGYQ